MYIPAAAAEAKGVEEGGGEVDEEGRETVVGAARNPAVCAQIGCYLSAAGDSLVVLSAAAAAPPARNEKFAPQPRGRFGSPRGDRKTGERQREGCGRAGDGFVCLGRGIVCWEFMNIFLGKDWGPSSFVGNFFIGFMTRIYMF